MHPKTQKFVTIAATIIFNILTLLGGVQFFYEYVIIDQDLAWRLRNTVVLSSNEARVHFQLRNLSEKRLDAPLIFQIVTDRESNHQLEITRIKGTETFEEPQWLSLYTEIVNGKNNNGRFRILSTLQPGQDLFLAADIVLNGNLENIIEKNKFALLFARNKELKISHWEEAYPATYIARIKIFPLVCLLVVISCVYAVSWMLISFALGNESTGVIITKKILNYLGFEFRIRRKKQAHWDLTVPPSAIVSCAFYRNGELQGSNEIQLKHDKYCLVASPSQNRRLIFCVTGEMEFSSNVKISFKFWDTEKLSFRVMARKLKPVENGFTHTIQPIENGKFSGFGLEEWRQEQLKIENAELGKGDHEEDIIFVLEENSATSLYLAELEVARK